ncbi:MAG: SDR family oxidoreductase [Pseudomonadota bacterium]
MGGALVLGRGGIGSAFAQALSARGAVMVLSRENGLDWEQPSRAEACLSQAAAAGPYDLIVDATGVLVWQGHKPEKKLAGIEAEAMAAQFAINAIGPALIFKHYEALLPETGRSVIATLSARVGSIGDNQLGGWISYRAAKAALNQIVRTASVEMTRRRPEAVVAALHPGTVATGLSAPFAGRRDVFTPEQSATKLLDVIDRLQPANSGGFFAYDGSQIPW